MAQNGSVSAVPSFRLAMSSGRRPLALSSVKPPVAWCPDCGLPLALLRIS